MTDVSGRTCTVCDAQATTYIRMEFFPAQGDQPPFEDWRCKEHTPAWPVA